MNIKEKVVLTKNAIEFIASHDDAPVEDIQSALKEVEAHARALMRVVLARRLGGFKQRLARYFARIVNALRGR